MKNFKFKWLLLSFILSIASINTAWGYELNWPTLYFDDMSSTTSPTTWSQAQFFYFIDYNGSGNGSMGVAMERITNTNLFYAQECNNRGSDISGFSYGFIESGAWPWEGGNNWTNRWGNRTWTENHSGSSQTNLSYGSYLCTSTGESNLTVTKLNSGNDGSSNLKYAQTVNVVLNGGTPSTSPAAITLTSGYWTDKKSVTLSPTSNITKGGSTTSDTYENAAYTATTTLEVGEPNSGIYFVGWYNGATEKSTSTSWTYYPREANTITARFENRYTVNVSADENGSITTGSPSVIAGYYTNPTITASANSHYIFDHWKVTGGASVADQYNSTTTVSASAAGTVEAIFAPVWAIMGGNNELKDGSDKMGDWQIYNGLKFTGTDWVYSGTIYLDANTTYQFKVVDRPNSDTYYGYGGSKNFRIGFVGQSGASLGLGTGSSNSENLRIMTAAAGYYTFTWNSKSDTRTLTVEYPEETHPSSNYVYFKKPDAWSEVYVHIFTNTEDAQTGWERLPLIDYFTFDGTNYYYAALGSETKCLFASTSDRPTTKTADLTTASSNKGKYYDNSTTSWKNFTATLTLDHQSPSNTPAPNTITVTYGASTNLTGDVITTSPAKGGYYTFGGYYTDKGGEGDQFIAEGETVNTNVPNYTDASKNWIKTGSSVSKTIYAKWTQTITLNQNGADENGTTSLAAIYNGVLNTSGITATPKKIGKKFAGWTTVQNSGSVVIEADGTVNTVASWTDGDKKWIHEGASTLYASWVADNNVFTNAKGDGNWNDPDNWSAKVVPTNSYAAVQLSGELNVSSYIHVGSMDLTASGAKLTIQAGGTLEVAGTITNTDASKIVINSTTTNQGALIFNSTGETAATVNMTMNAASDKFQFIAIPVSYVDVSAAFEGKGVYTYVWKNSAHNWEQRGYYDGISSYEAVIAKGKGSTSFAGNLVSNNSGFSSGTLSYSAAGYGDVYMFGNSWPAPIKRSAMTLSGIASVNILLKDNSWDGVISDDIIPALQAYAVVVGSSGGSVTINYDNAVRSVTSGRTTPLKAPQRTTTDSQGPISIYVSANEMQTRIRLFEDATRFSDELDEGWEAYYMAGEGYAGEMYAVGPERKMNVLATSNLEGTVVGFVPGQATDYTISFAGDGKGYYLNDVKKEESTLIAEGNTYEFTSDPSTNATRFVISKTPVKKTPTSIDNTNDGVKARKQLIDGALYIIRDGRIYTVTGALVK